MECYKLQQRGKQNWLNSIKIILDNFGFQEVWNNCGTTQQNKYMYQLECSLKSRYEKLWLERLNSEDEHNKLRTYCKFKTCFQSENYLSTFKNFDKRCFFTRLRTSSHDLHIETGRYTRPVKTPISNRLCSHCNLDKIEDEFHVVMKCTLYEHLRNMLFTNLKNFCLFDHLLDENTQFLFLMSAGNGDSEVSDLVINFISEIWAKRKEIQNI